MVASSIPLNPLLGGRVFSHLSVLESLSGSEWVGLDWSLEVVEHDPKGPQGRKLLQLLGLLSCIKAKSGRIQTLSRTRPRVA